MNNKVRAILSLAAIATIAFADKVLINSAAIVSGDMSVDQLKDVNQPVQQAVMQTASGAHLSGLIVLAVLAAIWFIPIKKLAQTLLAAVALMVMLSPSAFAYYDTQDLPEYVEILPNQTAFAIPEQGANNTTQASFMSEAYLTQNKVAMKRFQIPHALLHNPGLNRDYYIPASKLLVVDRTPYMREWVAESTRGTSTKDESFRFESADSVNISVGITISAWVAEENAAKFVYHFGAATGGAVQSNDPATTFASVIQGRSLSDVMDKNVRGKIQSVLAREFGKRSTDDCIHQKADIINIVQKEVQDAFAADGITIDFVGYATALNYDNAAIQNSIDETFIAIKKAQAANALSAVLPIQQVQADIRFKNALADAVAKWNGQLPSLPSFMVMSPEVTNWLSGVFRKSPEAAKSN